MKNKSLWFLLACFTLIISALGLSACGGTDTTTTSSSNTSTPTTAPAPTKAPTSAAPTDHKVGDTVKIGDWEVTVNGVKTSQGTQYLPPKKGVYLLIDVTVKNDASAVKPISSIVNFKLQDATGVAYTETITGDTTVPNPPDGNVQPGGLSRGTFSFDAPKGTKFTLTFTPDITSTDTAVWDLAD